MQWSLCSKIDFSKNLTKYASGVLYFLVASTLLAQIQHKSTVQATPDYLSIVITISGADVDGLFRTIRGRMRVRVAYRIRISYPRSRPFQMFGDRLLREFRPSVEARWDPYLAAYVMEADDGVTVAYTDEAAFYSDLFSLSDYRIPWSVIGRDSGLVVEASAEYTPIVFVPGLSILSLFAANRSESSQWSRHVVDPPVISP